MNRAALISCVLAMIAGAWIDGAQAATCNVPSATYPSIQAAVNDPGCTEVVLAAQAFSEPVAIARDLVVRGAGSGQTFINNQLEVSAGVVEVRQLQIAAPTDALRVHSGAEVSGLDLKVLNGLVETPLFADGFESGTTSSWSSATP
jgi:hypothetical protein